MVLDKYAPLKKKKTRAIIVPFMEEQLSEAIMTRSRLKKTCIEGGVLIKSFWI